MKEFEHIKDMVYDELDAMSQRGQLNKEMICVIGELVDILKDIGTVEMFEEGIEVPEDEYSLANRYSRNGGYSQRRYYLGNSYDGNSYRNGRNSYGRRNGYSRTDSKEHMIQQLHNLMDEAENETDRQSIHHLIEQMQNS